LNYTGGAAVSLEFAPVTIGYIVVGILGFIFISAILLINYRPELNRSPRFHYLYAIIELVSGAAFGVIHFFRPDEDIWIYAIVLFLAGLWEFWMGRRCAAKLGMR
jgi:hypothetical protein